MTEQQATVLFMERLGVDPKDWVQEMRIQNSTDTPQYYTPKTGSGAMMSMATRAEQEESDGDDSEVLDMFRQKYSSSDYYEYDWRVEDNYVYPNAPDVKVGQRVILEVVNATDVQEKIANGMDAAEARFKESNVYVYRFISQEEDVTEGVEQNFNVSLVDGVIVMKDETLVDGEGYNRESLVYHEIKVTTTDFYGRVLRNDMDDVNDGADHIYPVLPYQYSFLDVKHGEEKLLNLHSEDFIYDSIPQEWIGQDVIFTRNIKTYQGDTHTKSVRLSLTQDANYGSITEVPTPSFQKRGKRRFMRISGFSKF